MQELTDWFYNAVRFLSFNSDLFFIGVREFFCYFMMQFPSYVSHLPLFILINFTYYFNGAFIIIYTVLSVMNNVLPNYSNMLCLPIYWMLTYTGFTDN